MGRTSNDVREFRINKGKGKCKEVYQGYWGKEKLRDLVWKIARNHKKWGTEWYRCVERQCYYEAIARLEQIADRDDTVSETVNLTIDIINLIIDIEMEDN